MDAQSRIADTASLIDPVTEARRPVSEHVIALVAALRTHGDALGSVEHLERVAAPATASGATRLRTPLAGGAELAGVVAMLARESAD